ncbi:PIG-L family deacetylase [bacterium]|nr:PIG-L family deacetylase [bacterium]
MRRILVVAPHADDESLGCGGTLLRHKADGDETHWLLLTQGDGLPGMTPERLNRRKAEIKEVSKAFGFSQVHEAGLPATQLDALPLSELVGTISNIIKKVEPHTIYLPHESDVHSDHRVAFEATAACTKWFRYPSVKRVLAYETLSETDFGLSTTAQAFQPNTFVDISSYLERKIKILQLYQGELGEFPFPRSEETVRALATLRGAAAGVLAAESFVLLKDIL